MTPTRRGVDKSSLQLLLLPLPLPFLPSLPPLPSRCCCFSAASVKYFMCISWAFCKHFYIFYMFQPCWFACFIYILCYLGITSCAGSWWWHADWRFPRTNPTNRKSATSSAPRSWSVTKVSSSSSSSSSHCGFRLASAQVRQISWWNKKPYKICLAKKKSTAQQWLNHSMTDSWML